MVREARKVGSSQALERSYFLGRAPSTILCKPRATILMASNEPTVLPRRATEMQKIIATKVERIRSGVASGRTGWCRDRQQRPDAPSSSAAGECWTQQTTRSLWGPQASSRVAQTYPACIAFDVWSVGFISVGGACTPHRGYSGYTPGQLRNRMVTETKP